MFFFTAFICISIDNTWKLHYKIYYPEVAIKYIEVLEDFLSKDKM